MKKLTIKDAQDLAIKLGGKCLSTEYSSCGSNLLWECKEQHTWLKSYSRIKSGHHWCPVCAKEAVCAKKLKNAITIEQMHELAKTKGGRCLSTSYKNTDTHLIWECKEGHQWNAKPANIKTGYWCPKCIGRHKTKSDVDLIASKNGGKCLSCKDGYVKNDDVFTWECNMGHTWDKSLSKVLSGYWCPYCKCNIQETIVRIILEKLLNTKVDKYYPVNMLNSNGNRMHFDFWNESFNLAGEHQGAQHFEMIKRYHKDENDLYKRKIDDQIKRDYCKLNNINYFETIDFTYFNVFSYEKDSEKIVSHVCSALDKAGIEYDSSIKNIDLNTSGILSKSKDLDNLKKIAIEKGGECLSSSYCGYKGFLDFKCSRGHTWRTTPGSIYNGAWCHECGGSKKLTIEHAYKIAKERNGECLSVEYKNTDSKLLWKCKDGHEWHSSYSQIRSGKWCPYCAGHIKQTIEDMQKLAQKNSGKCISTEYLGSQTILEWECKEKHTWFAVPQSIKRGSWCPFCIGRHKTRIDVDNIAAKNSGRCLSNIDGYGESPLHKGRGFWSRFLCRRAHSEP